MLTLEQPIRTEKQVEQQQVKKLEFLGSVKPQAGYTLFELNLDTRKIQPAAFESQTVELSAATRQADYKTRKKLIVKDNCLYASALNIRNAEKKFVKLIKAL